MACGSGFARSTASLGSLPPNNSSCCHPRRDFSYLVHRTRTMSSSAFQRALTSTGYLMPDGSPVPGLARADKAAGSRLRPIFSDTRVGLHADAVFTAQNTPIAIFKDAGDALPTEQQISVWHEAAWNVGLAPLLWIVTPTDIRLYDCYASPLKETLAQVSSPPLDT